MKRKTFEVIFQEIVKDPFLRKLSFTCNGRGFISLIFLILQLYV
jgi:hypothetical protein